MANKRFEFIEEGKGAAAVSAMFMRARAEAGRKNRRPIVVVSGEESCGRLVVIHERDFQALTDKRAG
jgi:hypothetical protein